MVALFWVLKKWNGVLIFIWNGSTEIGCRIIILNPETTICVTLDNRDVVFLYNFNFNTDCVLSIGITVFLEMNSNNPINFRFVLLVAPQKILDILILSQRKFGIWQDGAIEFQSIHWFHLNLLLFLHFLFRCEEFFFKLCRLDVAL